MQEPAPVTFDRAKQILRDRFAHEAFLDGQEAVVRSVLAGKNLLVVMPTGSGKSLLYQLPALLTDGLTLVISPLIALMKDQVDELVGRGIAATFINSSLGLDEQRRRTARCRQGEVSLLYVAPERFRSASFAAALREIKIARLAVDEAHCISQWGHDFRPDYRRIQEFRRQMGDPVVTALTATATPRVQEDIIASLGLERDQTDVHVHGFDRVNLQLSVERLRKDAEKDAMISRFIQAERGAGIVYVGTRKVAEQLSAMLRSVEPRTTMYHAGMYDDDRANAQDAFLSGKARVVVATVAFGMGIDKPDVRFVIHYHYPGSIEQYYQEIGRAGRDALPSRCVLLYAPKDRALREFFIDLNHPTPEQVADVVDALFALDANPVMLTYKQIAELCAGSVLDGQVGSALRLLEGAGITRRLSGPAAAAIGLDSPGAKILPELRGKIQRRVFESLSASVDLGTPGEYQIQLDQLAADAQLSSDQVRRALGAMAEAGHITYTPPFRGRGVQKLVDTPPPFDEIPIDWDHQRQLREIEEKLLADMDAFIRSKACRRGGILRYFGEDRDLVCGECDNCIKSSAGEDRPRGQQRGPADREANAETAILACVADLRFPLGVTRIAQVVTGSQDSKLIQWGLDQNVAYGRLSGTTQEDAKKAVKRLIKEKYLKREGEYSRPVLALTRAGQAIADEIELDESAEMEDPQPPKPPPPPPRPLAKPLPKPKLHAPRNRERQTPADTTRRRLEELVRTVLQADREKVRALIDDLRMFHPRLALAELEARFDADDQPRTMARAVWAAGELNDACALDFLLRAAGSASANVRRLAASGIGKLAGAVRTGADAAGALPDQARSALRRLMKDEAPQVRQYAEKAAALFSKQ